MPVWPVRSLICLDCRTRCTSRCPVDPSHRVVPLDDKRLVHEVWGKSRALVVVAPAKSDSTWSGWDVLGVLEIGWCGLVVLVGALLWFLGAATVRLFKRRKALRAAQGARRAGPSLLRTGQMGYVIGEAGQVAFGVELRHEGSVMLRDGATIGFAVRLDSGATVRVPAGLCAFDMTDAPRMRDVEAYLPLRSEPDPFHHDDARHVTVEPGDRIEMLCELDPIAGGAAGYRDSAVTMFAPRGLVRLRRVPEQVHAH